MHARNHLGGEGRRGSSMAAGIRRSILASPWLVLLTRMDRRHFSGNRDDEYVPRARKRA